MVRYINISVDYFILRLEHKPRGGLEMIEPCDSVLQQAWLQI